MRKNEFCARMRKNWTLTLPDQVLSKEILTTNQVLRKEILLHRDVHHSDNKF